MLIRMPVDASTGRELETVGLLADEIGPRRPTGRGERAAAVLLAERLKAAGLEAGLEEFRGYPSFAQPFGAIAALALAPALLPRSFPRSRALLAGAAAAALVTEGGLTRTPLSSLLARRPSQNVVAVLAPAGEPRRTVCLMAHLDTSRSGLLFHPRLIRWLAPWINAQAAATLVGAIEPLLARSRGGRGLLAAARSLLGAGLALLIERELRGEDVPGANDNASGVAVCLQLASELAELPPEGTRTVVLLTGCEESGSLGAQHFLRGRDTRDWLFLNFDNVGAGSLHYLAREGLARKWEADPGLAGLAGEIAAADPALGLAPAEGQIGLIYDATPVLARGGRALTFVAAVDGVIPNYHRPSDTSENVDPAAVGRALAVGRQMVAAIDSGGADA